MARRSSKIKTQEGDAVEFIQQVNSILESMVDDLDIGEVVFVKIRNWFDQKWLNYSGKSIVHFPMRGLLDSGPEEALDCIWMKEITIPPFNPKRVLSSRFVRVKDTGNKRIEKSRSRLQAKYRNRAPSGQGLQKDGLLLWYSSNTIPNQKGCLMVYTSQNGKVDTWYALFENKGGWRVTKTKGIGLDHLQSLANERRATIA